MTLRSEDLLEPSKREKFQKNSGREASYIPKCYDNRKASAIKLNIHDNNTNTISIKHYIKLTIHRTFLLKTVKLSRNLINLRHILITTVTLLVIN